MSITARIVVVRGVGVLQIWNPYSGRHELVKAVDIEALSPEDARELRQQMNDCTRSEQAKIELAK